MSYIYVNTYRPITGCNINMFSGNCFGNRALSFSYNGFSLTVRPVRPITEENPSEPFYDYTCT